MANKRLIEIENKNCITVMVKNVKRITEIIQLNTDDNDK